MAGGIEDPGQPFGGINGAVNGLLSSKEQHKDWGSDPMNGIKDAIGKAEGSISGWKKSMDDTLRKLISPAPSTKSSNKVMGGKSKMMKNKKVY